MWSVIINCIPPYYNRSFSLFVFVCLAAFLQVGNVEGLVIVIFQVVFIHFLYSFPLQWPVKILKFKDIVLYIDEYVYIALVVNAHLEKILPSLQITNANIWLYMNHRLRGAAIFTTSKSINTVFLTKSRCVFVNSIFCLQLTIVLSPLAKIHL